MLPFIQLETDFLTTKAYVVAALLKVHRHQVVGMASDLFAFSVSQTSTKATPPDGVFLDPDSPTILEAVMGWNGEAGAAVSAFMRAGLIEKLEVGVRVRGMDRYKSAWARQTRPGPKVRGLSGRKPVGNPAETGREIESKIEIEIERLPTEDVRTPPPPVPLAVDAPKADPEDWAALDFWRWAQFKRQEAQCLPEKPPRHEKLGRWWSSARTLCDVPSLQEGFYRYGEDRFWQSKDPPLPFAGFMSQWEKYCRPEVRHAG